MNQQTFPASLFPLRGDVSAEAGAVIVLVQGIQSIPVTTNLPTNGQGLSYNAANNDLEWGVGSGVVQINGTGASSDFLFLVNTAFTINYSTDQFLGVRINGTRDGG
jgi:hypothetical protein